MDIVWILLAAASFAGAQVYLYFCLKRLDKAMSRRSGHEPAFTYDDSCRYPETDVVE